jgi:hypothetical protein
MSTSRVKGAAVASAGVVVVGTDPGSAVVAGAPVVVVIASSPLVEQAAARNKNAAETAMILRVFIWCLQHQFYQLPPSGAARSAAPYHLPNAL